MFSPEAAGPASVAARNPRRRQRTASEDSVAVRPNPKRIRRSNLTHETFLPPDSTKLNGHGSHTADPPYTNGHAVEPASQRQAGVDSASLALRHRGSKKTDRERRSLRNDGTIDLTKNQNYVVTQLPTTPESLRSSQTSGTWHGEISPSLSYALAMTPTQAIIWRYAQPSTSSESSQPLKVQLLNMTTANSRQPLPLGMLVPTSAEPALLVVMPASGKITFWESVLNAASLDVNRQKQQSVQGTVTGMMSGETVTEITEAEPRGFVLTLSTGRLAHLTVNDTLGKPSINVQFLRSSNSQGGGVFGSLRSVFSSAAWRKDIAAVRAGRSLQRGQRFIVVATTTGTFQVWDLSWNGTQSLVHDLDARDEILNGLLEGAEIFHDSQAHQFEVLDFTVVPHGAKGAMGKEIARAEAQADCTLMALTVLKGKDSSKFALVGMTLANGTVTIDVVHPISCYESTLRADSIFKPRLLIPESAQTAFVVLEKNVILVSLLEVEETPENQLQMEAHILPDPFQDTIGFKKTKPHRVVGCAPEPYDKKHASTSCVIMVYGFGLIRVVALPIKEGQSAHNRSTVTAQTKIEQAVFYGGLRSDLLDFTPRPEVTFSQEEIEQAAYNVSQSIMDSTSAYLPTITPSMDQQLSRRASALADLNKHLCQNYPPLSKATKWQLLFHAEKMAAARELWRSYDDTVRNPTASPDSRNVFTELVEGIHPQYKKENQPDQNETDGVRHWFIHDTWRLEWAIPYAEEIIETMFRESVEDREEFDVITKARLVSEATDIHLAALETAFEFREANAPAYGLDTESMNDGVLVSGYEDIPYMWTSNQLVQSRVKMLTDLSREVANLLDEPPEDDQVDDATSTKLMYKLASENPRQVQICFQTTIERYRWLKSRDDAESKAAGTDLQQLHISGRNELLTKLLVIGQVDPALALAEKYRNMDALAEIIEIEMRSNDHDEATQEAFQARINANFLNYGTPWANAFFTKHLDGADAVNLLNQNAISKGYLTKFLRDHSNNYAKIGWINEVTAEQEYGLAADFLDLIPRQTDNLWSQKVAMSMRKLTIAAAESKGQGTAEFSAPLREEIDQSLATLAIQEKLFDYVKPSVIDALDEEAEVDLAMERHGNTFVSDKPTLKKNLRHSFERLLTNKALDADSLIDTLTLIDDDPLTRDPVGLMPSRYIAALSVLSHAPAFTSPDSTPAHKSLHEHLIWRRLLIRDDWPALNRTENKPDRVVAHDTANTLLFQTLHHGYLTDFWTDAVRPLPPTDALLEAGTSIASLRASSRYTDTSDAQLSDIAADLTTEADTLDAYIDKGRLVDRWAGIVEDARLAAREELDRAGRLQAELLEAGVEMATREEFRDLEVVGFRGGRGRGEEADEEEDEEERSPTPSVRGVRRLRPRREFWGL